MAALGSQSIASSYEQLLHVDRDGGGDTTNHVSVKDGDNGTTFGFTIASDALMMSSTNRLEFGDTGTYIHQSADGVLDLVSDGSINVTVGAAGLVLKGTTPKLTIGDAGAEDTAIVFDGNAQDYYIGLDDTDDDFKIGLGSAVGTTAHMVIDEAGAITATAQPAFLVHPASTQSSFAEDTAVTVVFGTERVDQGGDFASNTFTAPVDGNYQFNVTLQLQAIETAYDYYQLQLVTSGKNYYEAFDPVGLSDAVYFPMQIQVLANMDAGNTAVVKIMAAGTGGGAGHDILVESTFSGYLAC
jgi:hypothetical protein